jgi:predicted nucleotidyltransferase
MNGIVSDDRATIADRQPTPSTRLGELRERRVAVRTTIIGQVYILSLRRRDVEDELKACFCEMQIPDLVAAYLFGSVAREEGRADSDVDVAVLFATSPAKTIAHPSVSLSLDLEARMRHPVQVVVLNEAPPDLVHRVLRDGRLVVDSNPSLRIRFEVRVRNEYFDLLPVLRRYRKLEGRPT